MRAPGFGIRRSAAAPPAPNARVVQHAAPASAGIALPRATAGEAFEPVSLTMGDVERLAAVLDAHPPCGTLVRFAACTGLRAGEVTGLRVHDVNVAAGHIEVRQTLLRLRASSSSGPEVALLDADGAARGPRADRGAAAAAVGAPEVGRPRRAVLARQGVGSHAVDYGGVLDVGSFRRNSFRPALREVGLPDMRFHDLRHTAASLWLAAGFSSWSVSRRLGHANTNTTDAIYAYLYPSDYSDDLARFEALKARGWSAATRARMSVPARRLPIARVSHPKWCQGRAGLLVVVR